MPSPLKDESGPINSDDYYIHYSGKESLRRNRVPLIVNKTVRIVALRCNIKNNKMILVHFQGKPFSITVIQICAPTTDAEEAEVKWFCDDLQDLLELTPKKYVVFIIRDWNAKVGSQEILGVTGKFGLGIQNEAGQRLTVLSREYIGHSKHTLPTTLEMTLCMDITRWSILKSD